MQASVSIVSLEDERLGLPPGPAESVCIETRVLRLNSQMYCTVISRVRRVTKAAVWIPATFFSSFRPSRRADYCDECVCLFVRTYISGITRPSKPRRSSRVHIARDLSSVILCRCYNILSASGLVDVFFTASLRRRRSSLPAMLCTPNTLAAWY